MKVGVVLDDENVVLAREGIESAFAVGWHHVTEGVLANGHKVDELE